MLTNTQANVIAKVKQLIIAQDKQLGFVNILFHVSEHTGERWCVLHSVAVKEGDVANQRENILWIGPRGRVIQLKQPQVNLQIPIPQLLQKELSGN